MQRFIQAAPKRSGAWGFLTGAALWAGAVTSFATPVRAHDVASGSAQDVFEDTALAVPRMSIGPDDIVAIPRPLPVPEARLLREAFRNPGIDTDNLPNSLLTGHLLAHRLDADTRAKPSRLVAWLERYADLPDAPVIHERIVALLPRGATPPPAPNLPALEARSYAGDVEVIDRLIPRNPVLDRTIRDAVRLGQFDQALRIIARTRGLTPVYGAILQAEVALGLFGQGHDRKALSVAEAANRQAHGVVGLAPWVSGLAAWRLGRFELARTWFEAAYQARLITAGHKSAAAYWAARASMVTRGDHGPWMRRAARNPQTFYGLLARRILGRPLLSEPDPVDTIGEADIEAIADTARGARAFALLQVGQTGRADAELRLLWAETRDQPGFGRSVVVVARAAGLNELASAIEQVTRPTPVRLPDRRLQPAGGFKVDPALIYALARLESNFDPAAVSPAGARGLMQLMPSTARYIQQAARKTSASLHDPATNLELGQRYLLHLAQLDLVGDDLMRLLASYNAGPGNLARWTDTLGHISDPLLFIESLPFEETRAYVPRALAYSWLYAAKLGLPSSSLDELAAGLWPQLQVQSHRVQPDVRLH